MRLIFRNLAPLLLAAAIASPVFVTGCTGSVRVYDPYYHDYHDWNREAPYYRQWENDTHRQHEDFNKRSPEEQKEYWEFRHNSH